MAQGSKALLPFNARLSRNVALTRGGKLLGGGRAAADALGVNERSWRAWAGGEREISNGVLTDTAAALEAHAIACQQHAAKLRELATSKVVEPVVLEASPEAKAAHASRFLALPRDVQLRVARGLCTLEEAEAEAGGQ